MPAPDPTVPDPRAHFDLPEHANTPDAPRPSTAHVAPSARHTLLATVALVLGGVAIGTSEFVTMGVLPQIADGVGITIPQAGHAVSAYAAGVVVGAPLLAVLGATWPRKAMATGLLVAFTLASVLTALAPGYGTLLLARFVSGMPHGAFFGIAAIIAVDLAEPGRAGRAVARVMLGIPIANVLGVPAATWLGQHAGWRWTYAVVAAIAAVAVVLVALTVPRIAPDREATVRRELREFASVQVALTLLVGAVGFGGMFAMLSYIAPLLTEVTGLPSSAVPAYLLLFGVGGVVGAPIAGRLVDWSVLRALVIGCVGTGATLAVLALTATSPVAVALTVFVVAVLGSVLVNALQLRLMGVARGARTLGAASNHASLNLANALGAWLGGLVIAAGWGYVAPSWVGVGLSLAGAGVLAVSVALHRRHTRGPAATA